MDDVWPAAQAEVAAELHTGQPDAIVFAPNTHELLVRLFAAVSSSWPIRVLTSDGEFHSARRQFARWEEAGAAQVERVPVEPFDTFSDRFLARAQLGEHDFIFVSQLMFGSGRTFAHVEELVTLSRPDGPWVVIDGYHAFMALDQPFGEGAAQMGFYLGGGYKYAMAGEGCAFLHAPPGFGERPRITGWFAEFEDLSLPPGSVGYARDARRFLGATFDPSGLYRFTAVRRMLADNGLTTECISAFCTNLQHQLREAIGGTRLADAELLNPLDGGPHARFLAFRAPHAQHWYAELKARNCITDVRGDVLRIGFGIYQDEADVGRLIELLRGLQ
jgi:selenocysteine lyase/cysteine desulfurase